MLFLGATLLLGFSFFLLRDTSPFSGSGGSDYERAQARRLLAKMIFIASLLAYCVAILAAWYAATPGR